MSTKFNDATFWNICLDFEKSHGSFLFDKNTNKNILDFFGMYSSLPLGYNHPVFDESFYKQLKYLHQSKQQTVSLIVMFDKISVNTFMTLREWDCLISITLLAQAPLAVESACKLAMYHT